MLAMLVFGRVEGNFAEEHLSTLQISDRRPAGLETLPPLQGEVHLFEGADTARRARALQRLLALRDVEFEVHTGEDIWDHRTERSGKSTMLKCIAGILQPTSGQIVVRGRLRDARARAGFQPELSGRDNIFLNASCWASRAAR